MNDSKSNIISEVRNLGRGNRNKVNDKRHGYFYHVVQSSVICLHTPFCVVPMDKVCTQPLSTDHQNQLEYHSLGFSLISHL
jgi:hypothetical protein